MRQPGFFGDFNQCSITAENGMLAVSTPYNHALVSAIKSLPYTDRKWDAGRKIWLVSPVHGKYLVDQILIQIGETVSLPQVNIQTNPEIKLFEVHYIGRCKDRGGEKAAFGMLADGSWGVIFPEAVLRAWFEVGEPLPMELNTLYAVLGVARQATGEEIKTGYRRMAKAWHPDLNRGDPDAADQFRRVQEAWEILSIPRMRARYDAGLRLEASMERSLDTQYLEGYRAPLRCGLIMAEGVEKLGRFAVSKIMEWQDIYNDAGQMLVVSWPMGAKEPVENWV